MDVQSLPTAEIERRLKSNVKQIADNYRVIPFMTGSFARRYAKLADDAVRFEEELNRRDAEGIE
jgi:hypothetical protein